MIRVLALRLSSSPKSARARLNKSLVTLGRRADEPALETTAAKTLAVDSSNSPKDELKPLSYFDRIHAASGGFDVAKTNTEGNARALVSHAMRSHSEVTGHNDANTMKDQLRMVGNRIFNDFELTGALKTRGRIKKRRNPPLVQRLVVTPSTEQVSSLDEAFDSFVQF